MSQGRANADRDRKRFHKPRPPGYLSPAEAAIWSTLCKDQDGEWCAVAAAGPALEMYCVTKAFWMLTRERLTARSAELEEPEVKADAKAYGQILGQLDALTEALGKQGGQLIRLANALRLTPQSRVRHDASKPSARMPWELVPEDDGDTA
jgi:phage terminase small subunit